MPGSSGSHLDDACRLCGAILPRTPLITFDRAPRSAQGFMRPEQVPDDAPVSLEIGQCRDCGLVQATCPAVPDWQHVIRSGRYSGQMRALRRRQFEHFLSALPDGDLRIIEVGCGGGDLLEILRDCGADAVGIEASPSAVARGKSEGLRIYRGYPTRGQPFPDGPFDAFMSVNVLEHAIDPSDFLTGIRGNLTGQAVGMIEVPSFERMLDQHRFYDFIADHLSYFTADTLRLSLEISGFDVLEISRDWWPDDLVAFVRVRPHLDLGGARDELDQVTTAIRAFVTQHEVGRRPVAVWGASHQALTLLALAGAGGVVFVVDAAPFKQGMLTPVTHLPVVSPERVLTDRPAAILVMAAGYSDEVVNTLRNEMGYDGVIGVLRGNGVQTADPLVGGPP
jgi:SAM-dependent methyltransferase